MSLPRFITRSPALWVTVCVFIWLALTVKFDLVPAAVRWPARGVWLLAMTVPLALLVRWLKTVRITGRKLLFTAILLVFYALTLEGMCWVFIKIMSRRDDRLARRGATTLSAEAKQEIQGLIEGKSRPVFSASIGWLPRPGLKDTVGTINQQGLRSDHEHAETPADPAKRFICMGDSFTFGVAVKDDECYPHYAEKQLPGTEWLNFGSPGCCLTQSYLRYHEQARKFGGRHVVIGFMTNDAQRTVNCFRPFLNSDTGFPMTKPFAKYGKGGLTIEPNPYQHLEDYRALLTQEKVELSRLLSLDYITWSQQSAAADPVIRTVTYAVEALNVDRRLDAIFNRMVPVHSLLQAVLPEDCYGSAIWSPGSRGFQAICALFDKYHDEVVADGATPLLVVLPGPMDVEDYREGNPRAYASLIEHFQQKGYDYLDFLTPLVAARKSDLTEAALFVRLHYQPPVNKLLAGEVIKALGLK